MVPKKYCNKSKKTFLSDHRSSLNYITTCLRPPSYYRLATLNAHDMRLNHNRGYNIISGDRMNEMDQRTSKARGTVVHYNAHYGGDLEGLDTALPREYWRNPGAFNRKSDKEGTQREGKYSSNTCL